MVTATEALKVVLIAFMNVNGEDGNERLVSGGTYVSRPRAIYSEQDLHTKLLEELSFNGADSFSPPCLKESAHSNVNVNVT